MIRKRIEETFLPTVGSRGMGHRVRLYECDGSNHRKPMSYEVVHQRTGLPTEEGYLHVYKTRVFSFPFDSQGKELAHETYQRVVEYLGKNP